MRVLLVDGDPIPLKLLEKQLRTFPDIESVDVVDDGDLAAELIPRLAPDVIFLDVRLPGRSGLDLARLLSGPERPEIVFVAASNNFATEAFELDAADYLVKPVQASRLAVAVSRARRRRTLRTRASAATPAGWDRLAPASYAASLWVPHKDEILRIDVKTIDWIEAAGDYVVLHTATRSLMARATMSGLQDCLDPSVLMRVSRSAFIRPGAVVAVERAGRGKLVLRLAGEISLPVGPTYTRDVISVFSFLRPLAAE